MGSLDKPELNSWPTSMLFFKPSEEHEREKPYYSTIPFSAPGAKQTNYASIKKNVTVQDIRGHEERFRLHECGFELAHHDTAFIDWRNGAKVKKEHYAGFRDFLKEKLQADRVVVFDYSVRPVRWALLKDF